MSSSLVAIAGSACFGLWMTVHFVPPNNLFAWHPLLMGAAIGSCGASSALGVRARAMAPGRARLATLWSHLWLNAFGTACWLLGFFAIYANKNKLGKSHFSTTHGTIGMWSTLALVVTFALGVASFNALGVLARFGWTAATRTSESPASPTAPRVSPAPGTRAGASWPTRGTAARVSRCC